MEEVPNLMRVPNIRKFITITCYPCPNLVVKVCNLYYLINNFSLFLMKQMGHPKGFININICSDKTTEK